jgi:cation diffusion facilitator family transporter
MAAPGNNKINDIRVAAGIALAGNAVLACLKISAGIYAKSSALIGDGIDSLADVCISVLTLVVVRIISSPADARHPWGHGRAETVATAFLSFTLFFMGVQLIISSASQLISGEQHAAPSVVAVIATLISIAGKSLLAWCQYVLGKRADSAMIKANAKNMAADVAISLGVLAGLAVSHFTGSAHADTIIAMLIGAWIIKTAVGIFLEVNLELMDGSSDMEPYRVVFDATHSVEGAGHPHRARMRRVAGFWDIAFDIEVDPKCTVLEAHGIASRIENAIKQRIENVFDIMIHVEPRGNKAAEMYGLSEDALCDEERERRPE